MADKKLLLDAAALFNGKHYFECHEILEDEWRDAQGDEKRFLQGLIMIAVGMYHIVAENYKGAVHVIEKGLVRLEAFTPAKGGLDLETLCGASRRALEKARHGLAGEPVDWTQDDIPVMTFE